MGKTVFWSWQCDLDERVTRELIRHALDEALRIVAVDLEEADRPSLTSDTQGIAGTPDIVATILRKIEVAAVFVGDVTPISVSDSGKSCANPNVLLEMGYANKALTEHRVIQVWNTAFEGATIEKLPFDMRGRRGPMAFHLPVGADTATLRTTRTKLTMDFVAAVMLATEKVPPSPTAIVNWELNFPGDLDVWFDPSPPQTVTNPTRGSEKIRWVADQPGHARLISSKWAARPDAKRSLINHPGYRALLADANSISFDVSRGGAMAYWPGRAGDGGVCTTLALTQWFEKTGEFWSVSDTFLFTPEGGRLTIGMGCFFCKLASFF